MLIFCTCAVYYLKYFLKVRVLSNVCGRKFWSPVHGTLGQNFGNTPFWLFLHVNVILLYSYNKGIMKFYVEPPVEGTVQMQVFFDKRKFWNMLCHFLCNRWKFMLDFIQQNVWWQFDWWSNRQTSRYHCCSHISVICTVRNLAALQHYVYNTKMTSLYLQYLSLIYALKFFWESNCCLLGLVNM